MKKNNISFLIAFLLLSSMTFSFVVSAKADYSYNYTETYFNYDVAEGDIFEYNLNYIFDFNASSTFYDEMDTWITNASTGLNNTLEDFSLETFINDLEVFLELDYKLQLQITEMYQGIFSETNSDGNREEYNIDFINASVQADLNEGEGWQTLEVVEIDKLEDSKTFMVNYLNDTQYEQFEAMVNMTINNTQNAENQPDWDNMQVSSLQSSVREYYPNGTLIEYNIRELENGTIEPENPFPEFGGPSGNPPIFFPTEMNFQEMYDFASDMFEFDLLYNLENEISIDPFESNDTLNALLTDGGINQIYVDEKSVGIVYNLDNFTTDFLEFFLLTEPTNSSEILGIADQVGTLSFAAEYDDVWALNTFAVYAHIGLTVDTIDLEGAPNLDNEDISLDITYTIAREGEKPPTEENIQEGRIGDNSPFDIPGFPIWLVGLFGIISIAALVVKHRK